MIGFVKWIFIHKKVLQIILRLGFWCGRPRMNRTTHNTATGTCNISSHPNIWHYLTLIVYEGDWGRLGPWTYRDKMPPGIWRRDTEAPSHGCRCSVAKLTVWHWPASVPHMCVIHSVGVAEGNSGNVSHVSLVVPRHRRPTVCDRNPCRNVALLKLREKLRGQKGRGGRIYSYFTLKEALRYQLTSSWYG